MGTRQERTLQDGGQVDQDLTPEGLGMGDFNELGGSMEDEMDRILSNPQLVAELKRRLGQ